MTDKEILQKVIGKMYLEAREIRVIEYYNILRVDVYTMESQFPAISMPYQCIIFSHDFAKAFWGEKKIFEKEITYSGVTDETKAWQYHLQQMVLWGNPLHYLATFLKSDCCNAKIEYTENSGVYICPGHFCTECKKLL